MFQELDPASVIGKQLALIRLICITHGVRLSPPSTKQGVTQHLSGRARRTGTDPVLMSKRSTPLENDGLCCLLTATNRIGGTGSGIKTGSLKLEGEITL